jgi:peroxiredoxin
MKKKFVFLLIIITYLMLLGQQIHAAECITPTEGGAFPEITLSVPQSTTEMDYIGIKGKGTFNISRIRTNVVILEIFSMYCPYCQKEAPNVNELYRLINSNPYLKDKIKIIGIGAGNTPFEVDVFKNQYNVPFPLFHDESFSVHKSVGNVRTPYFFVIKINADGSNKIIYSKAGSIQDPNQFLDFILKESGLKKEG